GGPADFASGRKQEKRRDAGGRDKTPSRSCPAQKRKNFVSKGADHSAALRGPFSLGSQGFGRSPPRQRRPRHFVGWRCPASWFARPARQPRWPPTHETRTGVRSSNKSN